MRHFVADIALTASDSMVGQCPRLEPSRPSSPDYCACQRRAPVLTARPDGDAYAQYLRAHADYNAQMARYQSQPADEHGATVTSERIR